MVMVISSHKVIKNKEIASVAQLFFNYNLILDWALSYFKDKIKNSLAAPIVAYPPLSGQPLPGLADKSDSH